MSVSSSPRNPDWQPSRVPKLAYRNPLPQDEVDQINYPPRQSTSHGSNISRNESVCSSAVRSTAPLSIAAPTKKKGSFLSGIFAREPTLTALAAVEADLVAKHGAATPQTVPLVSSRRMPEHVPKVNAKWDGVPEVVKLRERQEKQKKRLSHRSAANASRSIHSRSTEGPYEDPCHHNNDDDYRQRRGSDVTSSDSWRSQDDSSNRITRPISNYSNNSSEDSREDQTRNAPSIRPQSMRSPSGSSLPEITSFFPHHVQQGSASVSQKQLGANGMRAPLTKSKDAPSHELYNVAVDFIPEHSSSPRTTPRELSPVTPGYHPERVFPLVGAAGSENSSTTHGKRPKRGSPVAIDAFLAGEAKPLDLEEDDHDPAEVLDLPLRRYHQKLIDREEPTTVQRADRPMSRSEAAPWEAQAPLNAGVVSARQRSQARTVKNLKGLR